MTEHPQPNARFVVLRDGAPAPHSLKGAATAP
jgi:hypothetical protein